jgi:hypothetical protein
MNRVGAHGQEPMKIFKRGSMMQEHRPHQASQCGSEGQLDKPSTNFEFVSKIMHQP